MSSESLTTVAQNLWIHSQDALIVWGRQFKTNPTYFSWSKDALLLKSRGEDVSG